MSARRSLARASVGVGAGQKIKARQGRHNTVELVALDSQGQAVTLKMTVWQANEIAVAIRAVAQS